MAHELPPPAAMFQMVMGLWVSQAIGAAARLGVADHLVTGNRTAAELAPLVGADADALHRLLRALASVGVFSMQGRAFGLTPLGHTLRTGVPGSMRNIAAAETDAAHWQSWGRFTDAIKAGRSTVREALGMEIWEYYATHPDDSAQFSRAMQDVSGIAIEPVLNGYSFPPAGHIVDVGGAHGALLRAILAHVPGAKGTLFDLPHVIESARPVVAESPVRDRLTLTPGSFFEQVPTGGDVYLLKHIIHDWNDTESIRILRAVRDAMAGSARLLIVEMLLPPDATPAPAQLLDLNMLTLVNGRERTIDEYRTLLATAGLEMTRAIETPSPMVLVEAQRRD